MKKQTQKLEFTLKKDVINGFSYSFTNSLLKKLKKLKEEDRIFVDGWKKAIEDERVSNINKTKIADLVIAYLVEQLLGADLPDIRKSHYPSDIDNLIEVCEEFLSIFSSEKK